jgi:exonuclease VII large subunit
MIVRRSPVHAVARHVERIGELSRRLPASLCHRLSLARALCEHQHDLLTAMSYRSVLARGFSITRIKKDRSIVRSTKQVRDRQRLLTQTVDGEFESEVLNQSQLELFNE